MKPRGLIIIFATIILIFEIAKQFSPENNFSYESIIKIIILGVLLGWLVDYIVSIINKKMEGKNIGGKSKVKILDSSAIIDGRIIDVIDAGFVEGDIIVPKFVLRELQTLADSEDGLKRAKGRRGLDLIKTMQENNKNIVKITDKDYDGHEVDAKLVHLAKDISGDVVTTDFNLNKVATIQNIKVLNVNRLSNALKPMVIPNEELKIELIKKGDRDGQAVGYLNDGTMVVAEDGKEFLGETIILIVTSVYPTSAGRMIFGRVKR